MKNIFWLIHNKLAGRSGPDYEAWSLKELHAGGFDTIINLSEFEPIWDEYEEEQFDIAWFPLPNTYPATLETEKQCFDILPKVYEYLIGNLDNNRTVLVHCSWGRDRTGLLLSYYLAFTCGIKAKDAIDRIRNIRPEAITAPGWEEMAIKVIERLIRSF